MKRALIFAFFVVTAFAVAQYFPPPSPKPKVEKPKFLLVWQSQEHVMRQQGDTVSFDPGWVTHLETFPSLAGVQDFLNNTPSTEVVGLWDLAGAAELKAIRRVDTVVHPRVVEESKEEVTRWEISK